MRKSRSTLILLVLLTLGLAFVPALRGADATNDPNPLARPQSVPALRGADATVPVNTERLQKTTAFLTGLPHRLAGSEFGRKAGDHIIQRLKESGFSEQDIIVQTFPVTQLHMEEGDCYVQAGERKLAMQPYRPNGIALPVTPPEGITAPSVYLGKGDWENLAQKDLSGKIAVLDADSNNHWMRASAAGAAAIIFVGPEGEALNQWVPVNSAIPRYYLERPQAQEMGLLSGQTVKVFCKMSYQVREGRNILAWIPADGSNAEGLKQTMLLACEYDTLSLKPFAANGVRKAANVAGLLEAADHLRRQPLARNTLVMFLDNNVQNNSGQLYFYWMRVAYSEKNAANSLGEAIGFRDEERAMLKVRLAALEDPYAVIEKRSNAEGASDVRGQLLATIARKYDTRNDRLTRMLLDRVEMERAVRASRPNGSKGPAKLAPEEQATLDANPEYKALMDQTEKAQQEKQVLKWVRLGMSAGLIVKDEELLREARTKMRDQARANDWSEEMIETMAQKWAKEMAKAIHVSFLQLIQEQKDRWTQRLAEVDREQAMFRQYNELGARLADQALVSMVFWDIAPQDAPWTITIPSTAVGADSFVSNQGVSRWLHDLTLQKETRERFKNLGGNPLNVGGQPWLWAVSAVATYVVEFSNVGSVWVPQAGLSVEPAPDLEAYAQRLGESLELVRMMAGHADITRVRLPPRLPSLYFNVPVWKGTRYDGNFVRAYGGRSVEAEEPVPGAVVLIENRIKNNPVYYPDRGQGVLAITNTNGAFNLMMNNNQVLLYAGRFDEQGRIAAINQIHPAGLFGKVDTWNTPYWFSPQSNNQLAMFEVRYAFTILPVRLPAGPVQMNTVKLLNGINDVPSKQLNTTLFDDVLAVYTGPIRTFKMIQGTQLLLGNRLATPEDRDVPKVVHGQGYPSKRRMLDATSSASNDLWTLNEYRLNNLRQRNIIQSNLEELHAKAENRKLQAQEMAPASPGDANARHVASLAYSSRVYQPVRAVTNDLIQAVVILLLLAIPFCFALERVIIGTPNIYKQVMGFAVFFLAVFAVLYVVHPAFQFASFPIIVLLAFVIIIMSSVVIVIMWGKFEYEVKKLQGLATASHRSTRNYRSTIAAAVALGISTMRRRPLRTVLTAITIVLLTFTILFFGSFSSEGGIRLVYQEPGPVGPQVQIRFPGGKLIDPRTADVIRTLWADQTQSEIVQIGYQSGGTLLAGRLPDNTIFTIAAWRSLNPREIKEYPELKAALRGDVEGFIRDGGVFVPPAEYERIKHLQGKGIVDLLGRHLILRGTFDPNAIKLARTLNGDPFVPAHIEEMRRLLEQQYPRDTEAVNRKMEEIDLRDFPLQDPEQIAFVSVLHPERRDQAVQSITIYAPNDATAESIAVQMATMMDLHVIVRSGGQVLRALYANQISVAGLSSVAVPLLLGGLIIFSTMLSSVTDREREIFTFSAVGLAPTHVATLFFAEASVYAVIGGMGGYLFSQVFGKTVEVMARHGLTEAPDMNYSSMNAMITILLVMATVLISTIYPAIKASRSANPGIQRRWKMPPPEGDSYDILFPFTVSAYDMVGLVSFLEEYMASHRDKSVGSFASDQVRVEHQDGRFVIKAMVWLQPFDQGVSQEFELQTTPSQIEGIDEVRIRMVRLTGSPTIWQRSSKVFISDIREQFIFWRTIPEDAVEHYHQTTTQRFGLA